MEFTLNNTTDDRQFQTMADNYVCFLTQHAVPRVMTRNLITTGKWHLIDSLDLQSNPIPM
jgi:hypothetical protein